MSSNKASSTCSPAQGAPAQMMRIYGNIVSIPEFHISGDWEMYQERLEQYFMANMIEENRQVAVLLTTIGDQAYKIIRDLCDPVMPSIKTYGELVLMLKNQLLHAVQYSEIEMNFISYPKVTVKQSMNGTLKLKIVLFHVNLENA